MPDLMLEQERPERRLRPQCPPLAWFLRFEAALGATVERLLLAGIVALTLVMAAQVFCRYVVNYSLVWSEELARYLTIWLAFLGVSLGVRADSHFGITVVLDRVSAGSADACSRSATR